MKHDNNWEIMELKKSGIVLEVNSGKRVFHIYSLKPEAMYVLQYFNGQKKLLSGIDARNDWDFISVLPVQGAQRTSPPVFANEGKVYTKGKEIELLTEIASLQWRSLNESRIYLPFFLEQLLNQAIKGQSLLSDSFYLYYSYSSLLSPLHLFGLRGASGLSCIEKYFVSDTLFITPVLSINKQ